MKHYLDDYVVNLLHVNDAKRNKLIDLGGADAAKTYYLSREGNDRFSEYMLLTIREQLGHIAQTVLACSAVSGKESLVGRQLSHLDWRSGDGKRDASALDKFIRETYKNISFKGINPLFLSIGALRWQVQVSQNEFREVESPLLIFPIKLIRSAGTTPVSIEFVDDDIYFNPCLYQKMLQTLPGDTAGQFPHPNGMGAAFEDPIDLGKLGDGNAYFAAVEQYVRGCKGIDAGSAFAFDRNVVAIAQYQHSDLCMYYDYLRNREAIRRHPLVRAVFDSEYTPEEKKENGASVYPSFVLPHDSVQENMIFRALNGESMVIKGPPGTGKTVTIANMIAAFMAEQKNVLLVSSKISALSEVYHKLPEELRKFALLLDYESEAQAAQIDPAVIKKDLSELVAAAASANISDRYYEDRNAVRSEHSGAIAQLEQYHKLTFGSTAILGGSYYDAMERLCQYPNFRPIAFADPQQLLLLSPTQLHELAEDVRDGAIELAVLSGQGRARADRNPWYGMHDAVSVDDALHYYEKIGELAKRVVRGIREDLPQWEPCFANSLSVLDVAWAAEQKNGGFSTANLRQLALTEGEYHGLCEKMNDFFAASAKCSAGWVKRIGQLPLRKTEQEYRAIPDLMLNDTLRLSEIQSLYGLRDLFCDARGVALKREDIDELIKLTLQIKELKLQREELLKDVWEVFRETADEEDLKKLHDAVPVFQKYKENGAAAPGAMDLKAKLVLKNLIPLCYLRDAAFQSIVSAACRYSDVESVDAQIFAAQRNAAHIYKKELTEQEWSRVAASIELGTMLGSKQGTSLTLICSNAPLIEAFAADMECDPDDTVGDLKLKYAALRCYGAISDLIARYAGRVGAQNVLEKAIASAKVICAWYGISNALGSAANRAEEIFERVGGLSSGTVADIDRLMAAMCLFSSQFFENYYTSAPEELTMADLLSFAERCGDRACAAAACRYHRALMRHGELVGAFFRPFESGEAAVPTELSLDACFVQSAYALAVDGFRSLLRSGHYPAGRAVASNYEKISRTEEQIRLLNRKIIEKKLLSYIRPEDADFRFLNHERGAGSSVRKLFRDQAEGICKLKKCMIMSPSTASVLLRHPSYSNFDAVIIDEASQMESVTLLPVLFRAKQCIMVGDEWQMPPMKHFETKIESVQYREEDELPEDSALSLALKNTNFQTAALVCHYRSRTESLIKFSQESFYPTMRTFPSPVPQRSDLGFSHIYLADGVCEAGVNEKEARQIVECVRKHFETYYDDEKGRLTRSFGVVTFGQPQLNRIRALIRQDAEFSKRWQHRGEQIDVDDPFFYCTVETVQGQQTTDLYLSMTYTGHSSLHRNELGSQVFNVAVSRATDTVTVVHSVKAADAKPDYVRRYLEIVEYFSEFGKSPFVSAEPTNSFAEQLRSYLAERFGIARDRILCNYGATAGSVRIPLVILSPDHSEAQLGIFCEAQAGGEYHYVDYHVRYYDILRELRGWNLHRAFLHDWLENPAAEQRLLDEAVRRYVSV